MTHAEQPESPHSAQEQVSEATGASPAPSPGDSEETRDLSAMATSGMQPNADAGADPDRANQGGTNPSGADNPTKKNKLIKKGLVVIHGVGQQRQSETMQFMASPLIEWMRKWIEAHDQTIRVNHTILRFGPNDDDPLQAPTHAHIMLGPGDDDGDGDQKKAEKAIQPFDWTIAEAWWAWSNVTPSLVGIGTWLISHYRLVSWRFWLAQFRHVGSVWDDIRQQQRRQVLLFLARWLDIALTCVTIVLAPFAILLGVVALVVVVLLSQVPIAAVQNFALLNPLTSFLTVNAGEMFILDNDEVQAANFRERLERAIRWLADNEECKEIYIMAHSAGSIISYQTLCKSADLWSGTSGKSDPNVVKLFTMGEGLNLAWRLQRLDWWKGPHQWRLFKPLNSKIKWLDFWAGQDPAPAGKVELPKRKKDQIDQKHRIQPFVHSFGPAHPEEISVTNWMDVLSDHGGYWDNDEEVLFRVACEIDAGAGKDWTDSENFYKQQNGYATAGQAGQAGQAGRAARITRVGSLTAIRLGFYALAIAAAFQPGTQKLAWYILHLIGNIPGVAGIASVFNTIISGSVRLAHLSPSTPVFGWIGWLFNALPALILMALLYTLLCTTLTRALWDQWDIRMRTARIYQAAPRRADAHVAKGWGWLVIAVLVLVGTVYAGFYFLHMPFLILAGVLALCGYGALPFISLVVWMVSNRKSLRRQRSKALASVAPARPSAS